MTHPAFTPAEARQRDTFLALMWALSYPGRTATLPAGDALAGIGEALLDLETTYYTPDAALAALLARSGARRLPPDRAAYHFYPQVDAAALADIALAAVGSMLYPDDAATLIIGCRLHSGAALRLTGPGIPGEQRCQVAAAPELWSLRARSPFPTGWDVFLVDGLQVVGLPRSTRLHVDAL
ncbi:MAG: phosphonate C-P lyase system protein PhnH [Anaerolineae bacterium]|jgi:alpha-D-ribose 1-methylphosphonate 5-triphosphate synthase subunit PhnH|nr:phosphonate C-P lyase system protein PhnH [Anaerolineae bacterium]